MRQRLKQLWLLLALAFTTAPVRGAQAPPNNAAVRCARQLQAMGRALSAYQRDRGELPPHLSELYPDYLKDRALLHCPADPSGGTTRFPGIEPDPVPTSYLYEMSLAQKPFGLLLGPPPGGKISTWRDLKIAHRVHFGDLVPVVSCWHHVRQGYRQNLTLTREVYRSIIGWEYEPAAVHAALSRLERDLAAGPTQFRRYWWPNAIAWYSYALAGRTSVKTRHRLRAAAGRLAALARSDASMTAGDVWSAAGSLYYAGGDAVKAAEAFEAAIQRTGQHPATPYLLLADIYRRTADPDKATDLLRRMPAIRQSDVNWMGQLGEAYMNTGRPQEAAHWQREADMWRRIAEQPRQDGLPSRLVVSVVAVFLLTLVIFLAILLLAVFSWRRSLPPPSPAPEVSQIQPWVRFWARHLDMIVWTMGLGVILTNVAPSILEADIPDAVLCMGFWFSWIPIEAFLLSSWGTTPGKWLLKIKVRDSAGEKLTFSSALNRSFAVWWSGLAIGFPLAQVLSFTLAYNNLKRDEVTSWDRMGGFVVSHERIGIWRVIVGTLALVGVTSLGIWANVPPSPRVATEKEDRTAKPHWSDYDASRKRLYVSIQTPPALAVVDTTSGIVKRVPLDAPAEFVALNPKAQKVYIATPPSDTVTVIDAATLSVTSTLKMRRPRGLAIDPKLNRVYISSDSDDQLRVVNGTTDRIVATIPTGTAINCIAIDRSRHRVYATHWKQRSVTVVDGKQNKVVGEIALAAPHAYGLAVNPSKGRLYVAHHTRPGRLSVVDTDAGKVVKELEVGVYPINVSVDPSTHQVYIANFGISTLSVVDGSTHEVTNSIEVGLSPVGIAIDAPAKTAYVACKNAAAVVVINTQTSDVTARIRLSSVPAEP